MIPGVGGLRYVLLPLLLGGCAALEFSPNQTWVPPAERNLTAQNLTRLYQTPPPAPADTLRFVFIGDSQRFYDEAEAFVRSVNQQRGIHFVLLAGDLTDFGLPREMRWLHHRLRHLRVPYLTVIGNHDQVANGRLNYQRIYGPLNYSFEYGGTRFVLLDTNSREYGFPGTVPNVAWLRARLADTAGTRRQVVVCHVPPTDSDFDPRLVLPYAAALRASPRVVLHLAGHVHRFSAQQPFQDGLSYLTGYSFGKRRYQIVSLWGRQRQFHLETVTYADVR
ncbi:Calcineurin-like phosphoesterase [Hymenobacter daecheongensis DSM 21074]|uniref:Calcineurin-like phosphoesterase n=1 Tax=Hymenobacter daecheongensis DSM 21074 TaxID=1121955 RepID=A0A1M6ARE6_9BACT|nr:metallophosphoesterase [Hymenobacter daecheongensis]SHI39040.1 Calcineurin-like phosphoesterase [Hymenobacter daecheongensis DSM 21074]